jgi:hypothetical protein
VAPAHLTCVFTAFSLLPRKCLIRKCCQIDPLEKSFDLPTALVERANRQRRQRRVVGQADQRLARLRVLEFEAMQKLGVVANRVVAIQFTN